MDHGSFDRLARLLGIAGSRRAALGALLGTGLTGALSTAEAAKKDRSKRRKASKKGKTAQVSAQAADCLSPGPSTNISGCPYQGEDFSGDDLSGSRMVGTNFRDATLVRTNLSSSNARNAVFREADLTCANLRSSTLGGADFRAADLTLATLKSSGGCNSATFNSATYFCGTVMCDGSVRNDDCAGGPPSDLCCTPCGVGEECIDNECACDLANVCIDQVDCDTGGTCLTRKPVDGGTCFCGDSGGQSCDAIELCTPGGDECDPGFECVFSCCPNPICMPACGASVAARRATSAEDGPRPDPS